MVDSFSSVAVECCKLVWTKKSRSNSGKKLKPHALKRLVLVIKGPGKSSKPKPQKIAGLFLAHEQQKRKLRQSSRDALAAPGEHPAGRMATSSSAAPVAALAASCCVSNPGANKASKTTVPMLMSLEEEKRDTSPEEVETQGSKSKQSGLVTPESHIIKKRSSLGRYISTNTSKITDYLGAYDAKRGCVLKTIKGKLLEAKMSPGENGFMYAPYGGADPEKTEIPVLLWQERQKPPPGDEAPVSKSLL